MKNKIGIIFLSVLTVLLVTGCGSEDKKSDSAKESGDTKNQTLVCTTVQEDGGMNTEEVVSMTFKNDKLSHMTVNLDIVVTDSSVQENWQFFKKSMDATNQEFDSDGVSLKVSTNDSKYEYKTTVDIDLTKATDEALAKVGFEGLKESASTLENEKKTAENNGATCVVK